VVAVVVIQVDKLQELADLEAEGTVLITLASQVEQVEQIRVVVVVAQVVAFMRLPMAALLAQAAPV
jgi:hypothetical protein